MIEDRVIVDTSVMIDLIKTGHRSATIEALIRRFHTKTTTSIALLEYKATVMAVCIKIHADLRRYKKFTYVRDVLQEKNYKQSKLRAHIFSNWVAISAPSLALPGAHAAITPQEDERLGEKARLKLEMIIPYLYQRFQNVVDDIAISGINCTRAQEPPKLLTAAFDTNLPNCSRENKSCNVEAFIRNRLVPVVDRLRSLPDAMPDQIASACEVVDQVAADASIDVSHSQCRRCGDLLIALEGLEETPTPTHLMSTNEREWKYLAERLGVCFTEVNYGEF
jgi:hypothetical protein